MTFPNTLALREQWKQMTLITFETLYKMRTRFALWNQWNGEKNHHFSGLKITGIQWTTVQNIIIPLCIKWGKSILKMGILYLDRYMLLKIILCNSASGIINLHFLQKKKLYVNFLYSMLLLSCVFNAIASQLRMLTAHHIIKKLY